MLYSVTTWIPAFAGMTFSEFNQASMIQVNKVICYLQQKKNRPKQKKRKAKQSRAGRAGG